MAAGTQTVAATLELGTPVRILATMAVGAVLIVVCRRVLDAAFISLTGGTSPASRLLRSVLGRTTRPLTGDLEAHVARARRLQRAHAVASLVRSTVTFTIVVLVTLHILRGLHVDIAKLMTAAGLVSVILGFGAQTLIKDFIAGLFLILEEQYGVGDVVDVGPASGTVEQIGLRVTRVRADDGTVWIVRNGEILRVGNKTQGWSRAVVEVKIDYDEDVDAAQEALLAAGASVAADQRYGPMMLDEPDVRGIEDMTAESVLLRLRVKTIPSRQWEVARALRAAVRAELAAQGVALASQKKDQAPEGAPHPATGETPILDGRLFLPRTVTLDEPLTPAAPDDRPTATPGPKTGRQPSHGRGPGRRWGRAAR